MLLLLSLSSLKGLQRRDVREGVLEKHAAVAQWPTASALGTDSPPGSRVFKSRPPRSHPLPRIVQPIQWHRIRGGQPRYRGSDSPSALFLAIIIVGYQNVGLSSI